MRRWLRKRILTWLRVDGELTELRKRVARLEQRAPHTERVILKVRDEAPPPPRRVSGEVRHG